MMKRDGAHVRVLSREAVLELLRPLVGRVRTRVQRAQWRRHAVRQHRRLMREIATRPEKLLLVCASEARRSRLSAKLGAGPLRLGSVRLVRSEVEEADLILCASMEDFIEMHRLFPRQSAHATLLGFFATPRRLDVWDVDSAMGHLREWLSTLPRARRPGLGPAAQSPYRLR